MLNLKLLIQAKNISWLYRVQSTEYRVQSTELPNQNLVEIGQGVPELWSDIQTNSETLNNEYIERIYQMSYSSLSDNGMLQIFSFLIKWLYGTL